MNNINIFFDNFSIDELMDSHMFKLKLLYFLLGSTMENGDKINHI